MEPKGHLKRCWRLTEGQVDDGELIKYVGGSLARYSLTWAEAPDSHAKAGEKANFWAKGLRFLCLKLSPRPQTQ